MYRKIVWCYIIVLTLLDIPLNTKLSAQGKSHGNGVSVHESLMEGYSLQDWGKDPMGGSGSAGPGRGRPIPAGALQLAPARLAFGRAALAAPHVLTVTITNTANETIHLASVAGTTPDFHSSFFDSKTLAPQANTSFSVVYLGRREGPVSAYLYIHTSKGIYKYPVSAVGVASEYRVWPLVGVRVPHNATLEPTLTLYNPTDTTIQVSEVYSSGSWLGLALPGGGSGSPSAAWAVPPHAERPLVALQLRPDPGAGGATAYVRVRWSRSAPPLVVAVEALAAPPGEYVQPAHVRLGVRGSRDPAETFPLAAGNSGELAVALAPAVEGAACTHLLDPLGGAPPPPPQQNGRAPAPGARLTLLHKDLPPRTLPTATTAHLTLDYEKLWASVGPPPGGVGVGVGARCGGWARVGRAAAPYSLTLLPGTLDIQPQQLHFVTANVETALERREVRAHNQFPVPVRVNDLHFPDELERYFHIEKLTPLVLAADAARPLARVRLRPEACDRELSAELTVRTNVTDYRLQLLLYSGKFHIEWDWPTDSWSSSELDVGVVPLGSTVEVTGHVAGGGVAAARATAALPGGAADLTLTARDGGGGVARLRVTAPLAGGAARGWLEVRSPHAATRLALALQAAPGDLAVLHTDLPPAAPYVWSSGPLVVESSMSGRMRVVNVTQPCGARDPALSVTLEEGVEVHFGRTVLGRAVYAPEMHCRPDCYTGLDVHSTEGSAWVSRGGSAALAEDARLWAARRGRRPLRPWAPALRLHTAGVRRAPGAVRVPALWPRLAALAPGAPPTAAVAMPTPIRLVVANPSSSHPLLLQFVLHPHAIPLEDDDGRSCPECVWCSASFTVGEWRATRGAVGEWGAAAGGAPYALLAPRAEADLSVTFTPRDAAHLATYLYIRNNLTIIEKVLLSGVGAHPTFELGGRAPNATSALVVEVAECGVDGDAGTASRALTVRNTGRVPLRLRGWRVAGQPCGARGFRLQPCAALALQPNESRALHLAFAADWTRARQAAVLTVRAGERLAAFPLAGAVPARTLARCAPHARRPPFEPALRALGAALALLALAGAAALAAADAERALRRHRAARAAPAPPRPPLDLRALSRPSPAPAAVAAPRRRRTPRRRAPTPLDPAAERRAFERWRAEVERRAGGDPAAAPLHGEEESPSRSHSEEEGGAHGAPPPRAPHRHRDDTSSSSPDCSPPPRDSYSMSSRLDDAEEEEEEMEEEMEEGGSTVSETSSGGDERSEGDAPAAPPAPPPPPASPPRAHPAACLDPLCTHHESRRGARAPPAPRTALRPAPRRVRRRERPASPPRAAARASPRPGAPPAAVRWGTATWSSVVSRGPEAGHAAPRPAPPPPRAHTPPPPHPDPAPPPPLAPIGSDVRRRLGSHSLFFYSGETSAANTTRWPPSEERPPEARWGAGEGPAAAWSWGAAGGGVRPPPGFAPRVYDPFHSLASIWTPAALDWRADAPTPPLDDKFDPTVPPPPLPTPPGAPPADRSNPTN